MHDFMITLGTFIVLAILIAGCPIVKTVVPGNECNYLETRCMNGNVETCGSDRRWRVEVFCSERGEGLTCSDTHIVGCVQR